MLNRLVKHQNPKELTAGFTLIEILVVIGLIAILAAVVIIAINPARQFAQGRNSQRTSNINAILNSIGQRMADNKGLFAGAFGVGTATFTCPTILLDADLSIYSAAGGGGSTVDLSCVVPTYIPALPTDPTAASGDDTGYDLRIDSNTGRTTVKAPGAELNQTISVTR